MAWIQNFWFFLSGPQLHLFFCSRPPFFFFLNGSILHYSICFFFFYRFSLMHSLDITALLMGSILKCPMTLFPSRFKTSMNSLTLCSSVSDRLFSPAACCNCRIIFFYLTTMSNSELVTFLMLQSLK